MWKQVWKNLKEGDLARQWSCTPLITALRRVSGQPGLHSKVQNGQSYTEKHCLKTTTKRWGFRTTEPQGKGKIYLRFENCEVIVLAHFLIIGVKGFQVRRNPGLGGNGDSEQRLL